MDINIEHRLTEVEDRSKSNQRRIEYLEQRQDNLEELTATVKGLAIKEENIEKTVDEIKGDVKNLTGKPGKRWDSLVEKVIAAIVLAFVGYMIAKLGL